MPAPKLTLALAASLALAGAAGPLAAQHVLTLGSAAAEPGGSVALPLTYEGDGAAVALQLDVVFDPAILSASAEAGSGLGGHVLASAGVAPGRLRLVIHSPANAALGDGELALLTVVIDPEAPLGTTPLALAAAVLSDADAAALGRLTLEPGSVEVAPGTPPQVALLGTVPDTGDGQLAAGEATSRAVTQLVVRFSLPVRDGTGDDDPDDVTNPENYLLLRDAADDGFATADCAAGVAAGDAAVALEAATYDAPSRTAVVQLDGPALPAGLYRLFVCGTTSIVGATGTPLDGDGDGVGGDDFARDFRVRRTHLLENPNFDRDLASWTVTSPDPGAFEHSPEDAEEAPSSGSAEAVAVGAAGELLALAQCVAVEGATRYRVGGRVRVASGLPAAPIDFAVLDFHAAPGCSGPPLSTEVSTAVLGDTAGAWIEAFGSSVPSPPGAQSALVSFVLDAATASSFTAGLDHLTLFRDGVFADGFESGNTSRWSATTP